MSEDPARLFIVLFLDVDGVLNPYAMTNPRKTGLPGYHKVNIQPDGDPDLQRLWATDAHGPLLHEVADQIVWATSWVRYPNALDQIAAHCGLPAGLPRIDYDHTADVTVGQTGKLDGVRAWLEANSPDAHVFWVDDHLGEVDIGWAYERSLDRTCTVKTIPQVGLSSKWYAEMAGIASLWRETSDR